MEMAPSLYPRDIADAGKLDPLIDRLEDDDAMRVVKMFIGQRSVYKEAGAGAPPMNIMRAILISEWEARRLGSLQRAFGHRDRLFVLPWSQEAVESMERGEGRSLLVREHVAPIAALVNRVFELHDERGSVEHSYQDVVSLFQDHYRLAVLTKSQASAIDSLSYKGENGESLSFKDNMPEWCPINPFVRYRMASEKLKLESGPSHFDFDEMRVIGIA